MSLASRLVRRLPTGSHSTHGSRDPAGAFAARASGAAASEWHHGRSEPDGRRACLPKRHQVRALAGDQQGCAARQDHGLLGWPAGRAPRIQARGRLASCHVLAGLADVKSWRRVVVLWGCPLSFRFCCPHAETSLWVKINGTTLD